MKKHTSEQKFWLEQIESYEREFKKWEARCKKIIKRYRDERPDNNKTSQFNILWSNVQTLSPALYASPPKPNIDRRFQDDDNLGLTASRVLERASSYYLQHDDFDDVMRQCVEDRLLPGRGVAWVRYCPDFGDKSQLTDDQQDPELYGEDVVVDYVHWRDFGHSPAKTWQEVRAVWRAVGMEREDLKKRFPKDYMKIPLDEKAEDGKDSTLKKGTIYEIWDKRKREVIWLSRGMEDILDKRPDPLSLKAFFPCPKPMFATLTNDSLVPVPDYVLYQDQAQEMDMLTARIGLISEALKVAGVYDASAQGVQNLLSSHVENKLIPVENWAIFGEKGGLKGVVDWFPVEQLVTVITALYEARDNAKQTLYEITGISDIIRGATNANETATAQQIKGQYASLRLDHMQKDVSRFARDLVKIITEIIAEHFSMDTIKQVSGIRLLTAQEKQLVQQQSQIPDAPPLPDSMQEMMTLPTWEEVEQLIRDDMARCFRIDIETDSTIKTDQEAEKQARIEFLTSAGSFIQQASKVEQPELAPLLMEMLMFGVRGFKVGRDMETTFETALNKIKRAAENPQPKPDPEAAQREHEMKMAESQAQREEMVAQREEQAEEARNGFERERMNHEVTKQDFEREKMGLEKQKIIADIVKAVLSGEKEENPKEKVEQTTAQVTALIEQLMENQANNNAQIAEAITKPRTVLRDSSGRISGIQ